MVDLCESEAVARNCPTRPSGHTISHSWEALSRWTLGLVMDELERAATRASIVGFRRAVRPAQHVRVSAMSVT